MNTLFAFFNLGTTELIIIMVVGVILFGRRLPEVGRYLGKGIVEFKKGIRGIEDDIDYNQSGGGSGNQYQAPEPPRPPQRIAPNAPKFEDTNVKFEDANTK